ncbi:MAG: DUF1801 domain-containing protein [Gemmatimonadaceae bacterium]|nr:DUF1801 domain-containing protein [Gemmatimonadaceae bacterium]
MPPASSPAPTIDSYIAGFPPREQAVLQGLRARIRQVVPDADEAIKYGMPTFVLHGNLVHFAGWKQHLGIYGMTPAGDLATAMAPWTGPKGALLFPWDEPLPLELIERVIAAAAARRRATFEAGLH